MEQRVSLVTLGVDDVARSAAFYETLGWKRVGETPDMVEFDLLSQGLALYDRRKLAADLGMGPLTLGTGLATYAYNVRSEGEVARVIAAARAAGGRIVKEAQPTDWGGHHGFFADPDGHLWEIAFNPFSPLSPEGAFRWGGYGDEEN